jgi:hypothetical protein
MRQTLIQHPDSRCSAVASLAVEIAHPRGGGSLALSYVVAGKIGDLRLPAPVGAKRADELWRHTCFEAFVRNFPGEAYYEFNFSPSTQWAGYRFDGYRSGMRVATEIRTPRIEIRAAPERYVLRAELGLPGLPRDGEWRLGLSAVIEEKNGNKSYWALAHPPGKPDFHHADCFKLNLSKG